MCVFVRFCVYYTDLPADLQSFWRGSRARQSRKKRRRKMGKIILDISGSPGYNDKANRNGRLAQLVAHPLDVREVTSSSLVSSTTYSLH